MQARRCEGLKPNGHDEKDGMGHSLKAPQCFVPTRIVRLGVNFDIVSRRTIRRLQNETRTEVPSAYSGGAAAQYARRGRHPVVLSDAFASTLTRK